MIILITSPRHGRTLRSLATGQFGVPTPVVRSTSYPRLFRALSVPRATYIFGDLERLTPSELAVAADLYRTMRDGGLTCLNDPARTIARVELLTTLYDRDLNPVWVGRADELPRPPRFPVFIRPEHDHSKASDTLYSSQAGLDAALERFRSEGTPLRGLIVTEQVAAPYADGLFAKWGTYRIGDRTIVEHIAVDDTWLVKHGDHDKITDDVAADEHDAVATNRFGAGLMPAFAAGAIEFGRADHATVNGRVVIYEINTNPSLSRFVRDRRPIRHQTQLIARRGISEAFAAIDTPSGGSVRLPATDIRKPTRWWRIGFIPPKRA